MQQIFQFLIKNSYKLLFLLLLIVSLIFTIQSHSYHKSEVISSANYVSGNVYEQVNSVEEYFSLKSVNEELAIENARLKMILFNRIDSVKIPKFTEIQGVPKTNVILSKVIHNSFNTRENYITINSGSLDGVKQDMGVINSAGIVGIVDKTSSNFATVATVLNIKSRINAKVKKSDHFGSLIWDGKNAGFVQLIDVPRLASVRKGDTIVTGGQSVIFPENINIGTIDKVYINNENNYYTINVRLFNDMTNLQHVYIIKDRDTQEVTKLQKKQDE